MSHPLECDTKTNSENHFNTVQKPFPPLIDGKINTEEFIDASRGVVTMVERLGSVFSLVKNDMNGNVEKITKRYQSDRARNMTIHQMILLEQEEKSYCATDGLVWLNRALHFTELFLEQILSSSGDDASENLKEELTYAYSCSLKQYHNWAVQQVFWFICKICPTRTQFINSLGTATDSAGFYKDLEVFLQNLKVNRMEIHRFLVAHQLNQS